MKASRRDADDQAPRVPDLETSRQNTRVAAEMRLPQVVADHHHRRRSLACIVGSKEPANRRLQSQGLKEGRRHLDALDAQRATALARHERRFDGYPIGAREPEMHRRIALCAVTVARRHEPRAEELTVRVIKSQLRAGARRAPCAVEHAQLQRSTCLRRRQLVAEQAMAALVGKRLRQ